MSKDLKRIKNKLKKNKIDSYSSFKNKYPKDYEISLKKDFLHELKLKGSLPNGYWTIPRIKRETLKYNSLAKFRSTRPSMYDMITKKGLLKETTSHMKRKRNWTFKTIHTEARKYKTRSEFLDKDHPAYLAAHKRGIINEVCSHMKKKPYKPIKNWTKDELKKIAKKYSTKIEWRREDRPSHEAARRLGLLNELCTHMKIINKPRDSWSKRNLKKEAKKYETRTDFKQNSTKEYVRAIKMGVLNQICSHMKDIIDLREEKFEKKLCSKIKKINKNIHIKKQVLIGKKSRIDLLLHFTDFQLTIPVEIKHCESIWTKKEVIEQKSRYDKILKNKKDYTKTYIVSPTGKWGYSEKEFLDIIKHLIEKEELYDPIPLNQLAS